VDGPEVISGPFAPGMNPMAERQEPRAKEVAVSDEALTVHLADGRTLIVPLLWFPRLWHGTPGERAGFEILGDGAYIHWPDLDEDLSVSGLLAGLPSGESPRALKMWLEARGGAVRQSA
jgi:Protein of unknown function (DUF2442)